VYVAIVRLSQVHDTRKQGLVTWLIQIAREKGVSAYVSNGSNRWAAAPAKDMAHLYRLAIEKTGLGVTTYHAVQEEGVSLRDIAETIGQGLKVPVVSIPTDKAVEHFGFFFGYAAMQICRVQASGPHDAWLGADWTWNDRGSVEYEVLTISVGRLTDEMRGLGSFRGLVPFAYSEIVRIAEALVLASRLVSTEPVYENKRVFVKRKDQNRVRL
jgi:hypothetical protein